MKNWAFLIAVISIFSGCSFKSSLEPVDGNPATSTFSKTNSIEAVSGGSKYETTATNGYKVRHSVGALFSKQVATTPKGYRVYSQVQGRISAEEDKQ